MWNVIEGRLQIVSRFDHLPGAFGIASFRGLHQPPTRITHEGGAYCQKSGQKPQDGTMEEQKPCRPHFHLITRHVFHRRNNEISTRNQLESIFAAGKGYFGRIKGFRTDFQEMQKFSAAPAATGPDDTGQPGRRTEYRAARTRKTFRE